ncbi:hypothetical protein ACHAXS_003788 [Conticribra weissflogii]
MGNSTSASGGTGHGGGGGSSGLSGSSRALGERRDRSGGAVGSGAGASASSSATGGASGSRNGVGSSYRPHLPSSFPTSLHSPFKSGTGTLGLSKAELDARCRPSGLYPSCQWEPKQIRRLIGDGKLAARLKGTDSRLTKTDRECPICFMYYSESNVTKCCQATICTECYLQIKPQKDKHSTCPFCNCNKLVINVHQGMNEGDVAAREEEEQRAIEALIRSRAAQVNGESPGPRQNDFPIENGSLSDGAGSACSGGFGSSLDNYNRSRTFSNASSNVSNSDRDSTGTPFGTPNRSNPNDESNALLSLAMTPEERDVLEREMREQLSHPTHRRMQQEAEEARLRHAQEWSRSDSGIRSRMREARLAELTRLLSNASRGNNDDYEEVERDDDNGFSLFSFGDGRRDHHARDFSGLIHALESSSGIHSRNTSGRGRSLEDIMRLEAAFLLGMDDDSRRHQRSLGRGNNNEDGVNDSNNSGLSALRFGRPGISLTSDRTGSRFGRGFSSRGLSAAHMDTASLLMRGISEEEQIAMAIALSMQESNASTEDSDAAQDEEHANESNSESSSHVHSGNQEEEDPPLESALHNDEEQVIFEVESDDERESRDDPVGTN